MKKPVVSVVMTIYNHEEYLKKSIKSIQNQSFKNWELIAIDNGSTDKSSSILKLFKDKRIKKKFLKKNIGRTKCLNLALKICKGRLIAIQDSDDISYKQRLNEQVKFFHKNKKCWLLATNYILVNQKTNFKIKRDIFKILENMREILFNNEIAHSSVMYRKKIIDKIGNYPSNYIYAQDYAFYLRAFLKFKIYVLKNFLVKINFNHENADTTRATNKRLRFLEHLKLLFWIFSKYKLSFNEKIKICLAIFKIFIKIIFSKFI